MVAQPADAASMLGMVKGALLDMVDSTYLDFADTGRYCRDGFGTSYHPAYQMAGWLTKLMFAYDYAQIADPTVWSTVERQRFLEWVSAAAGWYMPQVEQRRADMWDADGTPSATANASTDKPPTWSGGPATAKAQLRYNNHVPRLVRIPVLAGIMTGNEAMIDYGRRWVQEFLTVGVYPQGAVADFYRWPGDTGHTEGWKYGMENLGATLVIADHIARYGDASVYGYATTAGTSQTAGAVPDDDITDGGPKTLHTTLRQMMRYIDEDMEPVRLACHDCSDPDRMIRSRDDINQVYRASEWTVLAANVYFRDPYVTSIYMRSRPGTPPLPSNPQNEQGWITGGDHGIYPGVNFMFAQMEGKVWPYPE
jgi:hypothetical protein